MKKNYSQKISRLRERRLDTLTRNVMVSESFSRTDLGESIRYALEAMQEIKPEYTQNTLKVSKRVQENLTAGLTKQGLTVTYEHQGSVITNTHIMLHSDIDLLVLTNKFISVRLPLIASPPYSGDYKNDLMILRSSCERILKGTYDDVDTTGAKAITVTPKEYNRAVDVVICNWVDTQEWERTRNKSYRGVELFDCKSTLSKEDFPFMHIRNVQQKDERTLGGLRRLIRLLKTLRVDADPEIELSGFDITSVLYDVPDSDFLVGKGFEHKLLMVADRQLAKLISNSIYRQQLRSPNGKEIVFGVNEEKLKALKRLHLELNELITDISEELRTNRSIIY